MKELSFTRRWITPNSRRTLAGDRRPFSPSCGASRSWSDMENDSIGEASRVADLSQVKIEPLCYARALASPGPRTQDKD